MGKVLARMCHPWPLSVSADCRLCAAPLGSSGTHSDVSSLTQLSRSFLILPAIVTLLMYHSHLNKNSHSNVDVVVRQYIAAFDH